MNLHAKHVRLALVAGLLSSVVSAGCGGGSSPAPTPTPTPTPAPTFSYSPNPAIYVVGTPVTSTPTVTGAGPITFGVNPPLPEGLNLNQTTGVISGNPATLSGTAPYTITATNAGGPTSITLTMTVDTTWGVLQVHDGNGWITPNPPGTAMTIQFVALPGQTNITRRLRAQIADSDSITLNTQAYINFAATLASGVTFLGGSNQLQCQVTSTNPECDVVALIPAGVASTPITVSIGGAVTTVYNGWNPVTVNLTANQTPGPGKLRVATQAAIGAHNTNELPFGLKAPLWVVWDDAASNESVSVSATITGPAIFYYFAPGNNDPTSPTTVSNQTCTLTFPTSLSCGFGVMATAPSGQVTVNVTGTGLTSGTPYAASLTLNAVQMAPAARTLTFKNSSSQTIYLGINTGTGTAYVDQMVPSSLLIPAAQGGASGCGYTNPGYTCPPGVTCNYGAACPLGTTCIQGGANASSATAFQCFYDAGTPSPGYAIAPNGQSTLNISGSSVSPAGILWSGNYYARTGCNTATGDCNNGWCQGSAAGIACGPGTGPKPGMNTLAEATFSTNGNPDYYDISNIVGVNFQVQFGPTGQPASTASPYYCGTAGSMSQQAVPGKTLGAATWHMLVDTTSFPQPYTMTSDDPMSWYLMVGTAAPGSQGSPTPPGIQCHLQSDCAVAGSGGPTCGFDVGSLAASTFDGVTRNCGYEIGWITADGVWGANQGNTTTEGPFYFNRPHSLSFPKVGDLQLCNPGTTSSYDNYGGSTVTTDVCGGVIWGNQSPLPPNNPSTNLPLNLTYQTQSVNLANPAWLDNVLPTIHWLKLACPTCYTFPFDDMTSTFNCWDNGGSLPYSVTFSDLR
jgi:hypothetical protein